MRELTLEEKARAYDEALERAKKVNRCEADDREPGTSICEYIFPEIHEPKDKDEMIRKCLINGMTFYLERWEDSTWGTEKFNMKVKDILEWLEKQDKRKTLNEEDEHRIKLLEALCEDKMFESVPNSTMYEEMKITIDWLNSLRPQPKQEWDENDKCMLNNVIDTLKPLSQTTHSGYAINSMIDWLNSIRPLSKQEWSEDGDNCLSTIIAEFSKCAGKSVSRDEWIRCNDFLNSLKNRVLPHPKQEWSDEDEERIKNILSVLDVQVCWNGATGKKENPYQKEINWLKSLKDRAQPKQEWSEDDERTIKEIDEIIYECPYCESKEEISNWLKSIKQRICG